MGAESDPLPGSFRQVWLRFRAAEHLGTRLTRFGVRTRIPLALLNFGGACLFGSFLGGSIVAVDLTGILLSGGLFLVLMLAGVMCLRMLIGYYQTDRHPIALDLWSDRGPDPSQEAHRSPAGRAVLWSESEVGPSSGTGSPSIFDRAANCIWVLVLWVLALGVWAIALAVLYGIMTGEFVPWQRDGR